jgi:predicted acetyltransferase
MGPSAIDVRATAPHELRLAADTMRHALLHGPTSDEDWEQVRPGWEDQISVTAWDGDDCVGHAGAFRFDTVVPGGARVPTAGVTRVGVLPTATRQGVLTRMIRQVLDTSRAEGRILASLRASEAVIYHRFGFGIAADAVSVEIDVRAARPVAHAAPGEIRVLHAGEVLEVVEPLYDRVATRVGAITRSSALFHRYLEDAMPGGGAGRVAVHRSADGVDDGFVHYTTAWREEPFRHTEGSIEVHDVWGATSAVELALWQHVLGIDLVRTVTVEERPVDDVLRLAVRDPRSYQVRHRWDEQWVRLLDVGAVLAARTYRPASAAVTIAVTDPLYPDNSDTFEIGPNGVRRLGPGAPADLRCEIDVLSAASLGTVPWTDLAAAGRLVAADPDAAARADDLFAHRPGAFCGSFF